MNGNTPIQRSVGKKKGINETQQIKQFVKK